VDLNGCQTWSFILGKKSMLRVIENRVLKKIDGNKRDEEAGD
jgi:hypothetical protein